MSESTTTRVIYSGNVQGVGFRWNAREIAHQFPVTGFVRNLPNGTVELVVRGTSVSVQEYLDAVAHQFRHYITGTDNQPISTDEDFESFEIRR